MEKEEIEQYLKKLEEIEKTLNDDTDESQDMSYLSELEEVLNKLSGEITNDEVSKNINTPVAGQNIINTQPTMTGGGTLVKVKKLVPEAVIPSYSKPGDAGMDLTITKEIEIIESDLKKIGSKDSEKELKNLKKDCLSLIYEIDERKKEIDSLSKFI